MVQNSDIPYSFTFQWFHSSSRIHLFTLNNYVVIRHADTNSHSSTYFLVTNIFIRILNVLIHSHSRSYDFYSTLAFFIQHFVNMQKFTNSVFLHFERLIFFSRIDLFTSATYIQLHSMTKLLFNSFNINFYAHPFYVSFDPRLLALGSIYIIWKQATHLGDLESPIRRRSR